jgi:hypothetical protein
VSAVVVYITVNQCTLDGRQRDIALRKKMNFNNRCLFEIQIINNMVHILYYVLSLEILIFVF